MRTRTWLILAVLLAVPAAAVATTTNASSGTQRRAARTKIEHLVIVYDENESFDHYFGTYPHAKNPAGEPAFTASPGTPAVNGLEANGVSTAPHPNPNSAQPARLSRTQAVTCDQDHGY